ncbi:helix-turn-helix transcriptional regulator [Serratia marcescens]|uniref:helix-turn-helix transcriptional regulator n=1 Tax=Serratia marcescens TaxID=615 RepID=UPI00141972F1|nr:helix-turn-helix transcriptional regulator [Serratia marcescens]NIA32178.1 helix-turn-helix transcriptional regulator [Serratia marcescens]
MLPLLEHDPAFLCRHRHAPNLGLDSVARSAVVSVSAVDNYFARGLQAVVADIVRMSGRALSVPVRVIYRRGMVCVVMERRASQIKGVVAPWRVLPVWASLEQARRVLSALLEMPEISATQNVPNEPHTSPVAFTWREQRVLQLLRKGRSQTEAGIILGLSVKTVNAYKQRALRKLGLKNNRQLQYWLLENLSE